MKKLCLFLLFLTVKISLFCQTEYITNRQMSPQAYQFTRFGNIPAKTFVGELDFSIPLYIYEDRDFNIPVILQYTGTGFTPNKREGIVGHDWFLQVGGCITRKVEGGQPDEGSLENNVESVYGMMIAQKNNVYSYSVSFDEFIRTKSMAEIVNLVTLLGGGPSGSMFAHEDDYRGLLGHKSPNYAWGGELGPDIFNFSMPGHSGKFNLTWNGSVQTANPYKIVLNNSWITSGDESVTITAPDGYIYTFGGNRNAIEWSVMTPSNIFQPRSKMSTAWYLTKIQAPNGRVVEFIYKDNKNITSNVNGIAEEFRIYKKTLSGFASKDKEKNLIAAYFNSSENAFYRDENVSDQRFLDYVAEVTQAVYLDRIIVDNNTTIQFNYKSKGRAFYKTSDVISGFYNSEVKSLVLSDIDIYNHSEFIKKINFTQQFQGKSTSDGMYRLFLTDLTISGAGKYNFEYYSTNQISDPLTLGLDHWGYYNGGNIVIPSFKFGLTAGRMTSLVSTSRNPNPTYLKVGMLKKVLYPTGGGTSFDYDQHQYFHYVSKTAIGEVIQTRPQPAGDERLGVNGITGGARIKEIQDFDEDGNVTNKREFIYTYAFPEDIPSGQQHLIKSSGILLHEPDYLKNFKEVAGSTALIDCPTYPSVSENYPSDKHIQYAQVIEKYENNSYTTYKYNSYLDDPDFYDYSPSSYFVKDRNGLESYSWYKKSIRGIDRSYKRGRLKELSHYNQNREIVYRESINYQWLAPSKTKFTRVIYSGEYTGNKSMIENFQYLPVEKKIWHYFNAGNDGISRTWQYNYHDNGFLKENIDLDNEVTTVYEYSYAKYSQPYAKMINQNRLNSITRKIVKKNSGTILNEEIIDYHEFTSPSLILPQKITTKNNSQSSTDTQQVFFHNYDQYGNPVYISNSNSEHIVYLWGYKGDYPVARINNGTYNQVKTALNNTPPESFSINDSLDRMRLENLRINTNLKDAHVIIYSFKPNVGMTTITNPRAVRTTFDYDLLHRLQAVRDHSNKRMASYTYNYASNQSALSLTFQAYGGSLNTENQFTATASGGTGSFEYRWNIKGSNGIIIDHKSTGASNKYSYFFGNTGQYTITCQVVDQLSGHTKEVSRVISISHPLIKFSNITQIREAQHSETTAILNCHEAMSITFEFVFSKTGTANINHGIFAINGKQYSMYNNGTQLITINLPKGETRCVLQGFRTVSGSGSYATVRLKSINAGNGSIGDPSVLVCN